MTKKEEKEVDNDEPQASESENDDESHAEDEDEIEEANEIPVAAKPKKVHKLSLTETENFNEKLRKRGVLYIARIPPRMTPTKIKALLSEFGEVSRVFLMEEDASVRKRRKKDFGGSGGKRYIEGWVEFGNKRIAKHVAQSLNNTQISNQKRNPHYGTKIMYKLFYCFMILHFGLDSSLLSLSISKRRSLECKIFAQIHVVSSDGKGSL
jgi:ESF2/ABP1 family protein